MKVFGLKPWKILNGKIVRLRHLSGWGLLHVWICICTCVIFLLHLFAQCRFYSILLHWKLVVIKNPSSLFSFTLCTMPLIILLLFFFAFLLQEDFLKHNCGLIYFCVPHLHPLFKHCLKTYYFHVTSPTNLFSNSIWVFGFFFCWVSCQIKSELDPIILSHASFATEATRIDNSHQWRLLHCATRWQSGWK